MPSRRSIAAAMRSSETPLALPSAILPSRRLTGTPTCRARASAVLIRSWGGCVCAATGTANASHTAITAVARTLISPRRISTVFLASSALYRETTRPLFGHFAAAQLSCEGFAGPEHPHLQGADRGFEHAGHLLIREPLDVVHQERFALERRQLIE